MLFILPTLAFAGAKEDAEEIVKSFSVKKHIQTVLGSSLRDEEALNKAVSAINIDNVNNQLKSDLLKNFNAEELEYFHKIVADPIGRAVLSKQNLWSRSLASALMTELMRVERANPGTLGLNSYKPGSGKKSITTSEPVKKP